MYISQTTHGQFFALYCANADGMSHVATSDLATCVEALGLRAWPLTDLEATVPAVLPRTMRSLLPVLREWIARLEEQRPASRSIDEGPARCTSWRPTSPSDGSSARVVRHRAQPHHLRGGHTRAYWNGHSGGSGIRRFG